MLSYAMFFESAIRLQLSFQNDFAYIQTYSIFKNIGKILVILSFNQLCLTSFAIIYIIKSKNVCVSFDAFELWTLQSRTDYIFIISMIRSGATGYSFSRKVTSGQITEENVANAFLWETLCYKESKLLFKLIHLNIYHLEIL